LIPQIDYIIKRILCIIIFVFGSVELFAQIHISGALSGELIDTTYFVDDDIFIPQSASLTINPGANFFFTGDFDFQINGYLECAGNATDSITFKAANGIDSWRGIKFNDFASNQSILAFCIISSSDDSGIKLYYCSPTIKNSTITENIGVNGGGIYGEFSSAVIESCLVTDNYANMHGGGIYFNHFNPVFERTVVASNRAVISGGGGYLWQTGAELKNCTFTGNDCVQGGGLSVYYSDIEINNSIFSGNLSGSGIYLSNSEEARINYCNLYGNTFGNFTGVYPPEIGILTQVNVNGDSCDAFYNVYGNPHLGNPFGSEYGIYYPSVCIDAGDPAIENDPDSTISDMGAFYFDQNLAYPPLPFMLNFPTSGDTVWTLDTTLVWQSTVDPNTGLPANFDVYLDTIPNLANMWIVADSIPDTSFNIVDLDDDKTYYWTVRATDNNTQGSWAMDTLNFRTFYPEPMQSFNLLEPENDSELEPVETDFIWEESIDPDPGDIVNYKIWFVAIDDSIGYDVMSSNSITVNLDTVGLIEPEETVHWFVVASSSFPEMEIESNERFTFIVLIEGIEQSYVELADEFSFQDASPNPFNPSTTVAFDLPVPSNVKIAVYDVVGREITVLSESAYVPGRHKIEWDASGFGSGIYFIRMQSADFTMTQKVILLR